ILKALGLPRAQQNQISALTLLALCGIRVSDPWNRAQREGRTVTKGVMDFIRDQYKVSYAPNTRETVRRQVLHQFVLAAVADYNPFDPDLPTNSPRAHYAISEAALNAIGSFGKRMGGRRCWIPVTPARVDRDIRKTTIKTPHSRALPRRETGQPLARGT